MPVTELAGFMHLSQTDFISTRSTRDRMCTGGLNITGIPFPWKHALQYASRSFECSCESMSKGEESRENA